jgi:hypothetical protein
MRFASEAPDLLAEAPDVQHPLGPRHLLPVLQIVAIGLGCRFETPDGDGRLPLSRHDRNYATADVVVDILAE